MKSVFFIFAGIAAFLAFVPDNTKTPTKSDCVAYWTQRVQTWDNAPTIDTINNAAAFCGNIQ